LAACQKCGWALEYASPDLKAEKDVILVACQENGSAFKHASVELKANKKLS
jgi:uncharacterized Zn finger protein